MKYEIIEKAWCINTSNLLVPYFHDTDIIYYGTRGQAKRKALVDNDGGVTLNGEDVSFLNIRVSRVRRCDKIIYKNELIKRYDIKNKIRLENINKLPKDKFYYVQDDRNYVGNAVLWWGLNGNGYVTDLSQAHKYTWDEIQKFNPRESDIIWQSEHVENAIREYVDMQGLDRKKSL